MNAVMHTKFELKERGQSKGLSGILYVHGPTEHCLNLAVNIKSLT